MKAATRKKAAAPARGRAKPAATKTRSRRRPPPPAGPESPHPHVDRAIQYCRAVIAGKVVAGKLVRAACERQLRDLGRQASEGFPWVLSPEHAERACRFLERLRHVEGPKARLGGQPLELEPWQCFLVTSVFGWVHPATGHRRFRKVFVEIARKNGKSFLASGIGLYMLVADGEPGAQVYSAATKREQAKIVWGVAKRIVKVTRGLRTQTGVEARAHTIVQESTGSTFIPLSAEDQTLDGLNPHAALVDELHAHPTRGIYDILETAMGARDQPLMFIITTAGTDQQGICYEVLEYVTDVLLGKFADETVFGLVYTVDESDRWDDEACWIKANPNLGVSLDIETLRADARKAKRIPAARAAFMTKRLNIWVSVDKALFDFEAWKACGDPTLKQEAFAGRRCVSALDLASVNDFAARVDVYWEGSSREDLEVWVFAHIYTNQGFLEQGRHPQLWGWVEEGWLSVSNGPRNDVRVIRDEALQLAREAELVELGLDMVQAVGIAQEFQEVGIPVIEVPQVVKQMSAPTHWLSGAILARKVHHDANPVLAWNISNVVGHYDAKENVYPKKEQRGKKIDAAIATIMALSRVLIHAIASRSVYEERGIRTL